MDTQQAQQRLLNQDEAAAMLAMKPRTLEYWRSINYGLPYVKLGKLVRYRESDLVEFIERIGK